MRERFDRPIDDVSFTIGQGCLVMFRTMVSSGGWRAVMVFGPVVALSWIGAFAAFTDSVDATSEFSTGTVEITADDTAGAVAFSSLSMQDMTPGSTRYAALKISNAGTAGFAYRMSSSSTGDAALAGALTVGVRAVDGPTCGASEYGSSTVTLYAEAAGVDAASFAARPLAPAASEYLCFKVQLPSGAGNALQGLATDATFTFSAEA